MLDRSRIRRLEWRPRRNPAPRPAERADAGGPLRFIAPKTVAHVPPGSSRVPTDWARFNPALPGATCVYLYVEAHDTGDPPFNSAILFRTREGATEYVGAAAFFEYSDEEIHQSVHLFVPLAPDGTFEWRVSGGFREGYTIAVVGYL